MTGDACRRGKLPGAGPPDAGARAAPGGQSPVLEQDFDDASLYALRAAVAAHASRAGLPEGRTADLVLVVHELAANAIRHGAGHGRLRLWTAAGAVRCEITDDGPAGAADPDAAQWPAEPGHGLWLARQVADQASLDSGPSGTVAAVGFALRAAGGPGAARPGPAVPARLRHRHRHRPARPRLVRTAHPRRRRPRPRHPGPAPGPGPIRPHRVGLLRPGRADHRPAADRRRPGRPDGPGRAARPPRPPAARRGPCRAVHRRGHDRRRHQDCQLSLTPAARTSAQGQP